MNVNSHPLVDMVFEYAPIHPPHANTLFVFAIELSVWDCLPDFGKEDSFPRAAKQSPINRIATNCAHVEVVGFANLFK